MTYEEALKEVRHEVHRGTDFCSMMISKDSYNKIIEALEKAERYKWHDLRKNPNDLPKEGYKEILIAGEGGSIWNITSRMFVKYRDVDFIDIIKWKYIDDEE